MGGRLSTMPSTTSSLPSDYWGNWNGKLLPSIFCFRRGRQRGRMSEFRRRKILFDFDTFFDLNGDGVLTYSDFEEGRRRICRMSGWDEDHVNYLLTESLFLRIWHAMLHTPSVTVDIDRDGQITRYEWLAMWEELLASHPTNPESDGSFPDFKRKLDHPADDGDDDRTDPGAVGNPEQPQQQRRRRHRQRPFDEGENVDITISWLDRWLFEYLVFRFNMLDRTGNKVVDVDEFVYVLAEFGVNQRESRQAFTMFTQDGKRLLNFENFVKLFEVYYTSDDPSEVGNFINGRLDFTTTDEIQRSTSTTATEQQRRSEEEEESRKNV